MCDFASLEKGNLRKHLSIHGGERTNKCKLCSFASFRASQLRTHLKTHSGEKTNATCVVLDPTKKAI